MKDSNMYVLKTKLKEECILHEFPLEEIKLLGKEKENYEEMMLEKLHDVDLEDEECKQC